MESKSAGYFLDFVSATKDKKVFLKVVICGKYINLNKIQKINISP